MEKLLTALSTNWDIYLLLVIFSIAALSVFGLFFSPKESPHKFITHLAKQVKAVTFIHLAAIIVLLILLLMGSYIDTFRNHPISKDPAHWGQMGDFFGGMLNPILAFASFIALLYTIRIQSEELRLTRAEFEKSVKAQQEAVESQRSQVYLQQKSLEINSIKYFLDSDLKEINEIFVTELGSSGDILSLQNCFKKGLSYKYNDDSDASWEDKLQAVSGQMNADYRMSRSSVAFEDSTLNALAAYETMSVLSRAVGVSFFDEILLVYANRLTQYIVAVGLLRSRYIRFGKKIDINCPLLARAIKEYFDRKSLDFPPYINLGRH